MDGPWSQYAPSSAAPQDVPAGPWTQYAPVAASTAASAVSSPSDIAAEQGMAPPPAQTGPQGSTTAAWGDAARSIGEGVMGAGRAVAGAAASMPSLDEYGRDVSQPAPG